MGTLQEQHQHHNHDSQNNIDANKHMMETKESKKEVFTRKSGRSLADLQQNWRSSKSRQPPMQQSYHLKNNTNGSSSSSSNNKPESNHDYLRQRNGYNSRAFSKNKNTRYDNNNNNNNNNNKRHHGRSNHRSNQQTPDLYKTQLCDTYEEYGECKYGDACQYAHGKHELREKPDIIQPSAYKTVRCKNYWSKNSICPYGNKCKFVHEEAIGFDADKLNEAKSHAKYKTQECKTYNELGTCPYGDRCAFIHKPKVTMLSSALSADPSASKGNDGESNLLLNNNGENLITRRRVSQEFEDDLFGLNFASKLNEEQTKDIKLKKQTDLASYIDTLATMDTETGKDGLTLYTGAPLARQNSLEMFQEHSRFHKWSQVSTPNEVRQE